MNVRTRDSYDSFAWSNVQGDKKTDLFRSFELYDAPTL